MTTCVLKRDRDAIWLDSLPTSDASGVIVLLGQNNCMIAVPTVLLLAASPLVREMLSVPGPLPPAYSPVYLSIPAATQDVLEVVRNMLVNGTAADVTEEQVREVRQIFQMLMVGLSLICCHQSNSIDMEHAFDNIKVEDDNINFNQDELEISIKIKEEKYDCEAGRATSAANIEIFISEDKEDNSQLEESVSFQDQLLHISIEEDEESSKDAIEINHTQAEIQSKLSSGSLSSKGLISLKKNLVPKYRKTKSRVCGDLDENKGQVGKSYHKRASMSRIDCNHCDVKVLPSYYVKHCRRFHPQILKGRQKLSCPVCGAKIRQKHMHKHVLDQHVSDSSRNEKTVKTTKAVVKCDLQHSSGTGRRVSNGRFNCSGKIVKCDRCDANVSYGNLARHNRQAHAIFENRFAKCEICKNIMIQVKLKYHMKFVHGKT